MLKILIAEDDRTSRKVLWKVLEEYGECDLVIDGLEAVDAHMLALKEGQPYDLMCVDIMMPKLDGIRVVKMMRELEKQYNVEKKASIVMVTALTETDVVNDAFENGADAYATKPLNIDKLFEVLKNLELID